MDEVTGKIAEVRKKRTHLATRKSLWNTTLKELRSLNRNIEVGELRCMVATHLILHLREKEKTHTPLMYLLQK